MKLIRFIPLLLLTACSDDTPENPDSYEIPPENYSQEYYNDEGQQNGYMDDEYMEEQYADEYESDEKYIPEPYDEYCLISSGNGRYDGECSVLADTNYYGDNIFVRNIYIRGNPALTAAGIKSLSVTTFAGDKKPEFEVNTYNVTGGHFATRGDVLPEAIFPMDVNVMVPAKDASIFPDDAKPPYQFNSATLSITKVEDRPFNEHELTVNSMLGGVNGKQFIHGTMSVNISPLGSGAKDISPLKVTFRSDAIWRYTLPKDRTF